MTVRELREHLKTLDPEAKLFYFGGPDGDDTIELHEFHEAGDCYATRGTWSLDWWLSSPQRCLESDVVETRKAYTQ